MQLPTFNAMARLARLCATDPDDGRAHLAFTGVVDGPEGNAMRFEAAAENVYVRRLLLDHGELEPCLLHGPTLRNAAQAFAKARDKDHTYELRVEKDDDSLIFTLVDEGLLEIEVLSYHVPTAPLANWKSLDHLPWAEPAAQAFAVPLSPRDLSAALGTTSSWRVIMEGLPAREVRDGDTGEPVHKPGPIRLSNTNDTWTALILPEVTGT